MADNTGKLQLSDFETDALKEVANIGSGNASMALSTIFKRRVNIGLPLVKILTLTDISDEMNEGRVVGISSRIREGMDGNVFIFFPTQSALSFISLIKNQELRDKEVLSSDDEDILRKLSTIIYTAYINGLANFFEQQIVFSPPEVLTTKGRTFVESNIGRLDGKESLMIIGVSFTIEETKVSGNFTLVITMSSLSPLLTKLKKKVGG